MSTVVPPLPLQPAPARPDRLAAEHARPAMASQAGDTRWTRVARLLVGALCLLSAAWAVVSLWWPAGFDHGLYTWTADVVLRGGMVYADAWDMHGPLAAYLYAIPQAIVGQRFWGVRLLDLLVLALAVVSMARMVARASAALDTGVTGGTARVAGWWTGAIMVLAYASGESEYTAQPDGWVGLATAAILAVPALAPRPTLRHMALAGVVAGLFALLKPFYGMFVFVPLSYYVAHAGFAWKPSLRAVVVAGLVSLVPIAIIVAWFASRGAMAELLEVHVRYAAQTYNGGGLHVGERVSALLQFVLAAKVLPVVVGAAIAGGVALWRTGQRALLVALLVWIGVAVFCALLQNKYYHYHWVPAYPPIILLGALGIVSAVASGVGAAGRTLGIAMALVISAQAGIEPARFVAHWGSYVVGRSSSDAYFATFTDNSTSQPAERMRVGRYLRENSPVSATVAVWGYDPGVLYYAQRTTPFRMAAWIWPVVLKFGTPVQTAYEAEYARGLRERTPEFFVMNTRLSDRRVNALEKHPEIAREVAARFVVDTTIGRFQVMRRRAETAAAP